MWCARPSRGQAPAASTRARLVAVEESDPPAVATRYAAQCFTSRLDARGVQTTSSITQVTPDLRFVPRSQVTLVTGFRDGSRIRVEPALSETRKNRRLVGSKLGARRPQARQHVIWSNQRYLMCESHH